MYRLASFIVSSISIQSHVYLVKYYLWHTGQGTHGMVRVGGGGGGGGAMSAL